VVVQVARLWLTVWGLLLALGCSAGEPESAEVQPGSGALGELCQKTEDCSSTLCVRVDEVGGICSEFCATDLDCPQADNWACLPTAEPTLLVCACRKLGISERCEDGVDDDCNGKVDDCQTCDGVAVPQDDASHCRRCGNACRADQRCGAAGCECSDEERTDCGTVCADLGSDPEHCGACDAACGTEQLCADGACVCPDSAESHCAGAGCFDLSTDSSHCGECGLVCPLNTVCSGGSCVCPAGAPPDHCDGIGCVDLASDALNCGECGHRCEASRACDAGECVCNAGLSECDGACVDLDADEQHCGACSGACGAGQACVGGSCDCIASVHTLCGEDCTDLETDEQNCGECGEPCAPGEVCSGGDCSCSSGLYCGGECMPEGDADNCGACGNACPDSQYCDDGGCACQGFALSPCGDLCVYLDSDETHCGDCATVCKNGESCFSGDCACPSGQTYCEEAGTCVSLSSDEAHCGACGAACDPTETCQSSTCKCPTSGQLYCESEVQCVDTLSNTEHCGACDEACNPTEICQSSQCKCPLTGQLYCESEVQCVDTLSNTEHCGACDEACNPTEICKSGGCKCPGTNEQYCAEVEQCVDVFTDELHCGSCSFECPAQTTCVSKVCQCDQAGYTLCPDDGCYDLKTDPDNCNACGADCGGNYSCIDSKCACTDPTGGTEKQITNNTSDDVRPSLAWNGTNVGIGYREASGGSSYARFAVVTPAGQLWFDAGRIAQIFLVPSVAWTGSEFGVAYHANPTGHTLSRLDASANAIADAVQLGTSGTYFMKLGWSDAYDGYGLIWDADASESLDLRLLGADGTNPEATDTSPLKTSSSTWTSPLVAAPDGRWGIVLRSDGKTKLVVLEADGTQTLPVAELGTANNESAGLTHDGATFVSAYPSGASIYVNRGTTKNSPVVAVSVDSNLTIGHVFPIVVNGTLVIGWLQRRSGDSFHRFRLQRFRLPTDDSSAVTPIGNAVDLTPENRVDRNDIGLIATGPYSLLAVWSDVRKGFFERDLFAAPIDLHACP
jgi:hypothetical protein